MEQKMTDEELELMHAELDFHDRQRTLQIIWTIVEKIDECNSPGIMKHKLNEIKDLISEFIE